MPDTRSPTAGRPRSGRHKPRATPSSEAAPRLATKEKPQRHSAATKSVRAAPDGLGIVDIAEAPVPTQPVGARFRKRADVIAEEMKRWIVTHQMRPGDKLPQEHELTVLFGSSRWTIREALKSLEVQGLITISSGPRGGARILDVPQQNAMQLLANYFYFKPLTVRHLYDLRKILEPMLAVETVGHLTEAQLKAMDATIEATKRMPRNDEERREQRTAELEFHNIIAEACPNLLIGFICRFINDLLKDWVVFNRTYVAAGEQFSEENLNHHRALLDAFRRSDGAAVADLMTEHMTRAAFHTVEMRGELEMKFFPG